LYLGEVLKELTTATHTQAQKAHFSLRKTGYFVLTGEILNTCRILVGNLEKRREVARVRSRWEDKMNYKKQSYGVGECSSG
jgi:hypothetical protein